MTRSSLVALGAVVLFAVFHFGFFLQSIRVPVAPYERDYMRTDEPAYHLTPVKRFVRAMKEPEPAGSGTSDVLINRWALIPVRILGLLAFLGLAWRALGLRRGILTLGLFLLLPPAFPYLVRADSWMDSVSLSFLGLFFMSTRPPLAGEGKGEGGQSARRPAWMAPIFCMLGGVAVALALDAKLTAALTLIPAAILLVSSSRALSVLAGILAGFLLAQPGWFLDPANALAHLSYWNSHNDATRALPVLYTPIALFSSLPLSIWALAGLGLKGARAEKPLAGAAILALVPLVFFMVYRTYEPDGLRHLYLTLPFIAVLAAAGLDCLKPVAKMGVVALGLAELVLRTFPSF